MAKCECCGTAEATEVADGYATKAYRGVGLEGAWFSGTCALNGVAQMMDRIRALRAGGDQRAPKVYGTRPDVLPETLPVGTRSISGFGLMEVGTLSRRILSATNKPAALYMGKWWNDRAGYVQACHDHDVDWSTVPIQEGADVTPIRTQAEANAAWGEGSALAAAVGAAIEIDESITCPCRDCKSPATTNGRCVYCDARDRRDDYETLMTMYQCPGESRAYWRMRAADRRDAPRVTAESRELAKPHPWECFE